MTVTIDFQDSVALITMDDGKANAINPTFLKALNEALDQAEANAKAIVLTGRETRFSGGFDLNYFGSSSLDDVQALVDSGAELLVRLLSLPKPIVGACNGHAIAMGVFTLLACDTRIGARGDFKLGANETVNNMNLPVFAFELARERLAPRHYFRAIVQAYLYDPEEAVEAGYLDMTVAPENLLETAVEVAVRLGALPGGAYAYNKLGVNRPVIEAIKASLEK